MNLHKFAIGRLCDKQVCLRAITLLTALSVLCVSTLVLAQTSGNELKREYFIRQGADEALLIRITGNAADVSSNVYAPERRLLLSSSTNGNRIAPLFQFIDSSGKDRQLDIEVSASQFSANTQFDVGITRLKIWDSRSKEMARAYSLLSFGMQATPANTAAGWSVKINSLMGAAETFNQYGMTELKLWSTWLAADMIQTRLNDNNMALGWIKELQAITKATQWQEIDLATQQTKSAALIGLLEQGDASNPADVQEQLLKTAEQAATMGFRVTQSQALYQSGLRYVAQSNKDSAMQSFQQALAIAEDVADAGLVKLIRESMADMHAEQGDDQATAEVLRQLETQLAQDGRDSDELAMNLLQQGRIFMRTWEYPKAIDVLQQALGFENNSSIAGQINRELAMASHEIGQQAEALNYLQSAGVSRADAASYFETSGQHANLDASGLRRQAESAFQTARSLAQSGKQREARQQLDQLLDQVLFLRQSLPGVLGSWYWQRHEALLDDYLALSTVDDTAGDSLALLALSKSRFASKAPLWPSDTTVLRNSLMQGGANDATAKAELARLRDQFSSNFRFLSSSGIQSYLGQLSADEVVLTYHISTAGAYVWVADSRHVEMQRLSNPKQTSGMLESALNQISLANPSQFEAQMSALGDTLLSPVKQDLKKTIYLLTAGSMLALPFDSLRLNQRYLVESHEVVNVLAFPQGVPASRLQRPALEKVFLAGDPQNFEAEYANTWMPSEPIRTVKDIFVGPGLNIIQGAALLPDEFQSDTFQQADLVHLSMPGTINLGHPDQSWLQLSEPLRDLGRIRLRPESLRADSMQAELVYMAATHTQGQPTSALSQQLGFVSDLLQSGAQAVLVQLWVTSDEAADAFLKDFYGGIETSENVAIAIANSKRTAIKNGDKTDARTWSSVQLFIK